MGFFFKSKKEQKKQDEHVSVPTHIAIIPDGNRRWAKKNHLPVAAGHKQGAETFKDIVRYAEKLDVRYITFYAFSTENWIRAQSEVEALMKLLLYFVVNSDSELGDDKDKVRIQVIGDRTKLSEELQKEIARVENDTKDNTKIIVTLAINYGSRDEITRAVKNIASKVQRGEMQTDDINPDLISNELYTKGLPDPDLLIRTSGEERVSNYLLWQLAYTEFYFPNVLWPDFSHADLDEAIRVFNKRQRRYGGS